MSDLETGLKEAIEAAQPRYAGRTVRGNGPLPNFRPEDQLPKTMSAPEVIKAIEGLHERLRTLQGVAYELASELVGTQTYENAVKEPPPPPRNVFERMGVELLATTHTLDAIDRDIHACLVAVRP